MKFAFGAFALLIAASPALAHPQHIADHGHGHSHWLALAIFGGLGVAAVVTAVMRYRRRAAKSTT